MHIARWVGNSSEFMYVLKRFLPYMYVLKRFLTYMYTSIGTFFLDLALILFTACQKPTSSSHFNISGFEIWSQSISFSDISKSKQDIIKIFMCSSEKLMFCSELYLVFLYGSPKVSTTLQLSTDFESDNNCLCTFWHLSIHFVFEWYKNIKADDAMKAG